jgi:hypothetical protein
MNERPDCYACQHRRAVEFSPRSRCAHPSITKSGALGSSIAFVMTGKASGVARDLGVRGSAFGITLSEFNWPNDFDPQWLDACRGFTPLKEPTP